MAIRAIYEAHKSAANSSAAFCNPLGVPIPNRMGNSARARLFAVVLEDQHVSHPLIPLQVNHAGYPGPDDVGDFVSFQFMKAAVVSRRFGNHLVWAGATRRPSTLPASPTLAPASNPLRGR